jgi:hypothetical protein
LTTHPHVGIEPGTSRGRSWWRRALRGLLLLVYLAAAWPLVADTTNTDTFLEDLVVGVVVATLLLLIVAAVALLVRRWRYQSNPDRHAAMPTYRNALTSVPVVLVAFVIALFGAVGHQAQQQKQRKQLAASDAKSTNPQDRDRGALAAWMTSLPVSIHDESLALHQIALIRRGLSAASVNLPKLVTEAQAANRYAGLYLADVSQEPAATPEVVAIKAIQQRAARQFLAATGDYLDGLRMREVKLLNQGDAHMQSANRLTQQTAQRGEALYSSLGGYQAFGNRIDFQAYARAVQQAQQAAKP